MREEFFNIKNSYLRRQAACGLKDGDRVVVLRAAINREDGWDNTWIREMDETVGKAFIVKNFNPLSGNNFSGGVSLEGTSCCYPFFVLKKLPKHDNEPMF